jgi:hypothetical protein
MNISRKKTAPNSTAAALEELLAAVWTFLATAERSNRTAQAAVAEAMAPLVLW